MNGRLAAFGLVWALAGCSAPAALQSFGGPTMGSSYSVVYAGGAPREAVVAAVADELAAFDLAFSQWRADSEIARVNAHASKAPLPVGERFAAVLQLALRIAEATDGAFDPTVKPLRDLYRAARSDPRAPFDDAAIAAAVARIGHRRIAVRDGAVVKAREDVQVDLDGIVAGAACDAIAARL
ncbi:MAG: FAD:protein FMN transferase, partial [Planctomycetes bacterium]|nr:FAD:protein FMN transferase [Planctomycetota bacterium]